jgi:hypothetical protein
MDRMSLSLRDCNHGPKMLRDAARGYANCQTANRPTVVNPFSLCHSSEPGRRPF